MPTHHKYAPSGTRCITCILHTPCRFSLLLFRTYPMYVLIHDCCLKLLARLTRHFPKKSGPSVSPVRRLKRRLTRLASAHRRPNRCCWVPARYQYTYFNSKNSLPSNRAGFIECHRRLPRLPSPQPRHHPTGTILSGIVSTVQVST